MEMINLPSHSRRHLPNFAATISTILFFAGFIPNLWFTVSRTTNFNKELGQTYIHPSKP